MSSTGIYIKSGILLEKNPFSWKVLGIDDNGNIIYAFTKNLIVSWTNWGGTTAREDDDRTINAPDIYTTYNTGKVGIGTNILTGKLTLASSWDTQIYVREQNPNRAVNINLANTTRTRAIGSFSNSVLNGDIFYIGEAGQDILFSITPAGYVGIGTIAPQEKLEIQNGNVRISNLPNKIVLGTNANGTIKGSTSGEVYNYISWFINILEGPTWETWPIGPVWPAGPAGENWTNWTNWTNGTNGINGNTWATWFLQEGIPWATPYRNGTSRTTTDTNIYNFWTNVWIWVPRSTPIPAKLNVNWMIKLFDIENEKECNLTYEWTIRYKNKCFQWCDWNNRTNLWWEWCETKYQCIWELQTWAIANNILPVTNYSLRKYAAIPWQCTFTCDTDYIRNTRTEYCCNIPENATLYQPWTTTTKPLWWNSKRWKSLWWTNTINTIWITYQNWKCDFICNEWFIRNGDPINPLCEAIVIPTCGRGSTSRGSTICSRGE